VSGPVRYQNRFVATTYRHPRAVVVHDAVERKRWIQYFIDQRARARLDPALTDNQRKEINEACDAFEWTPARPVLVKEPIG
jgi:hypothetical protein